MNIVRNTLFESPDKLFSEDYGSIFWNDGSMFPVTFGWYEEELYIMYPTEIDPVSRCQHYYLHPDIDGREDLTWSGRLWVNPKIISFWDYPSKTEMKQCLLELSDKINNEGIKVDFNDDWQIEIIDVKYSNPANNETSLVPLNHYIGSLQPSKKELAKQHELSPLLKQHKKVPIGIGSNSSKRKPLALKQAMYAESIKTNYDKTIN